MLGTSALRCECELLRSSVPMIRSLPRHQAEVRSVSIGDAHLLLSFIIQLVPNDRVLKGFFGGMTQRPRAHQKIDSDSFDLESDRACGQIKGNGDHLERTPRRQDKDVRKYLVE